MNWSRDQVRKVLIDNILAVAPEADFAEVRSDRPLREQLDIDSFDFLTILQHLHDEIGVTVPEADYGKMVTLDGSLDYLMSRLSREGGSGKP